MADDNGDGLLAIEVDSDDYAETAAGDGPSVPRTFQPEADYQAQKAKYHAKIDTGNNLETLYQAVPYLRPLVHDTDDGVGSEEGDEAQELKKKITLSKKEVMLLGYAVGEMYYEKRYHEVVELCDRVQEVCLVDGKIKESLERWTAKCRVRMERA